MILKQVSTLLFLHFNFIILSESFVHISNGSNYKLGRNRVSKFENDKNSQYSYDSKTLHEIRKKDWINRSIDYYSRVSRRSENTLSSSNGNEERAVTIDDLQAEEIATRLYFARVKVKDGSPHHAEAIYRKIINEIMSSTDDDDQCDNSALAVSTLLLALLLQRMGDVKGTRSVFLNFFRVIQANEGDIENCACSAKVLQAFALFEMKRGNSIKSYKLVNKAVTMDKSLERVLRWKQFRDAGDKIII